MKYSEYLQKIHDLAETYECPWLCETNDLVYVRNGYIIAYAERFSKKVKEELSVDSLAILLPTVWAANKKYGLGGYFENQEQKQQAWKNARLTWVKELIEEAKRTEKGECYAIL